MEERTIRSEMLLGKDKMDKLRRSHVAVAGLGGVGSWCAEALARAGVGCLTLLDCDEISVSNINRQIYALNSTVGMPKAEAAAARTRDINPDTVVHPLIMKYEALTRDEFFAEDYDYVADCIDLVACKLDLIESCLNKGIPVISALGTGNKADASLLRICDISQTSGCPFARVIRKELKAREIYSLKVVFSPEEAIKPLQFEAPPPGRRSVPGSLVWVPAAAGLLMAQAIVEDLIRGIQP